MALGGAKVTFRLTRKLSEKLRLDRLPRSDNPDVASVWHSNLFRVGGVQYILLTESSTLFSVLLQGRGISDSDSFVASATGQIENEFRRGGWLSLLGNLIAFDRDGPNLLAAQDRSILSSMNEIVRMVTWEISNRPGDLRSYTKYANEIPLTRKGVMDQPVRRLKLLAKAG